MLTYGEFLYRYNPIAVDFQGMGGFMEPQVIYGDWIYIDTNYGSYYLPEDLFDRKTVVQMKKDAKKGIDMYKKYYHIVVDYIEGTKIYDMDVLTGWGARLSAPGYMDATEWSGVFETAEEAEEFLEETYGLDDDYEG